MFWLIDRLTDDLMVLQVMIDGIDVRTLNTPWLRSMIGLVGQEPVMFKASILDNIMQGNTNANTSQVS